MYKFILLLLLASALARGELEPLDPEEENNLAALHRRPMPAAAALADLAGGGGGDDAKGGDKEGQGDESGVGVRGPKPPVDFEDSDGDKVNAKLPSSYGKPGEFVHGFVATLSVIVVSELGDKTFFIAAIMAMRHKRATIFTGAISALSVMHVMSAFFGYAITIIPRLYTYYISSFLFAVFGIKMLKDGWKMSANEAQEEMEEVQEDLKKREMEGDVEVGNGSAKIGGVSNPLRRFVPKIFVQAFTMTFLAEWGDRSQLATIVLAAREEIKSVVIGGILGHAFCTGLAVLGGRFIAQRISVRTVTLVGGVVFIMFALTALFMDPNET